MSNPLTDAATRLTRAVEPQAPSTTTSSSTIASLPTLPGADRVAALEAQLAQARDEVMANRELIDSARDLRTQRNVLLVASGVLAFLWLRSR